MNFIIGSSWYFGGVLHREDGPAVESEFIVAWMRHGRLHRVDGPANISMDIDCWYVDGRSVKYWRAEEVRKILEYNRVVDLIEDLCIWEKLREFRDLVDISDRFLLDLDFGVKL